MSLCLDSVRVMCVADHVVRLTGLLPTFLHTASNQKLEAGRLHFTALILVIFLIDLHGFMQFVGAWTGKDHR